MTNELISALISRRTTVNWSIEITVDKQSKMMVYSAYDFVFSDVNLYLSKLQEDDEGDDLEEVMTKAKSNFSKLEA